MFEKPMAAIRTIVLAAMSVLFITGVAEASACSLAACLKLGSGLIKEIQ
uniref:Uncharacterized protein n=1 Tax=Candidatus Kentrum sp. FW TaxID=2126338 RepID=A0A450U0Z0_9GAMM|nr:MAG: hypothetical protein BECKFW1821C_GA0114237_109517 [Candidatus Kentron sp. FW]